MADETTRKLLALIAETGYKLEQENGQRRYGPRPGASPPPRGTEVFVARLPRDCFEDELVPIFSKKADLLPEAISSSQPLYTTTHCVVSVAPIYEMRLLMDFSGTNRGYAFVAYDTPEAAEKAILQLHGYQIRPGQKLGVVHSVDNRRLYVGDLPRNATAEELKSAVQQHASRVVDIAMYSDIKNKEQNRGFAFVEFESHRAASMARRALVGQLCLQDRQLRVDWAEPEPHVMRRVMSEVRVLYVRNLSANTYEAALRGVVELAVGARVQRVKRIKDYAFVHFFTRQDAECALSKLNGASIDGQQVEVKWAKPVDRDLYRIQKKTNGNSKYTRVNVEASPSPACRETEQKSISSVGSDSLSPGSLSMSPGLLCASPVPVCASPGPLCASPGPLCASPSPVISNHLFMQEDLLMAPDKLSAICNKYGWPQPVYYKVQLGCYWQALAVLYPVGPQHSRLMPGANGVYPTAALATAAAALDMLQLIQYLNSNGYLAHDLLSDMTPMLPQGNIASINKHSRRHGR